MTLRAEVLLSLLIAALYLKDSLYLLHPDEAVLVRRWGGGWHAGFGARGWTLGGKEPYLANPLLPHQPVLRLRWQMAAPPAGGAGQGGRQADTPVQLTMLGVVVWITWLELFLVIPAMLLGRLDGVTVLLAVLMLYANIVVSLVAVWLWRKPLDVSPKAFVLLAFECMVCAPYAANLVRRVSALRVVDEDFTTAAKRLLKQDQLDEVNRECLARIDAQIEVVPEHTEAMQRLQLARKRFQAKVRR